MLQAAMKQQQQSAVPRPIRRRTTVPRDRIAAHHRLYADDFAPEPRYGDNLFPRRFRMSHPMFLRIVSALERRYEYFRMREDAVGKPGYTPIQKCTAAIRQLAYRGAADMFDEYLHIGESTARECLEFFCQGVREIFGDTSSEAYPPRLPGFDDYARESAWVSENVGQHRLYALGMEELPIRLERVVHNRFQEQESHDCP